MGGNRRVRRGITGIRNTDGIELSYNSESEAGTLHSSSMPHSSRDRPSDSLLETRHADRLVAHRIHQKLYNTRRPSDVRQVLRSAGSERSGKLSREQLFETLGRLNIGLNDTEKELVIRRLPTDADGHIEAEEFMRSFDEGLNPLGTVRPGQQCHSRGTRKPFEPGTGQFRSWDWRRPAQREQERDTEDREGAAADGSGALEGASTSGAARQADDVMLMRQLAPKLAQYSGKLRLTMRHMDQEGGGAGRVGAAQFLQAVKGLHLAASPAQLQRLAGVVAAGTGGDGVDYERFCDFLELETPLKPPVPSVLPAGGTVAGALDIQPQEAAHVAASRRAAELRARFSSKGDRLSSVFKQYDVNNDGRLSIDQLTQCCQKLVPGLSRREVACLMVKKGEDITDGGDGYQDFREFIRNVMEDEELPTRRNVHARPTSPRTRNLGSLLHSRPVTPVLDSHPGGVPGATTTFSSARRVTAAAAEKFDAGYTAGQAVHEAGVTSVLRSLSVAGLRPPTADEASHPENAPPHPRGTLQDTGSWGSGHGSEISSPSSSRVSSAASSSSHVEGGGGAAAAVASLRIGRGGGRFYNLLQHDTSVNVKGPPGAPSAASPSDTFVRKSDAAFMSYQQEDQTRRSRHRQEWARRMEWKTDCEASRVERDNQTAERLDQARLLVKGAVAERAQERAELFDLSRRTDAVDEKALTLFGRPRAFLSTMRAN